jgi:hypothetical protein
VGLKSATRHAEGSGESPPGQQPAGYSNPLRGGSGVHRMRTGQGTKGTRHYDWAMLEVTSDDTPEEHEDGRFSDVTNCLLDGRSLWIGAHNREYAESYWVGYPGFYQRFMLSNNEVGTGQFDWSIMRDDPRSPWREPLTSGEQVPVKQSFDPDADYAKRFRAETTINTLTVLGPGHEPADLAEPRGPHSGQV